MFCLLKSKYLVILLCDMRPFFRIRRLFETTSNYSMTQGFSCNMTSSPLCCETDMTSGSGIHDSLSLEQAKTTSGSADIEMAAMDALPDELLLHILSFVGDARTLLYGVALVCKRWHRLHREPAAWADVDLFCMVDDAEDAWVLLHAPAARSLRLDGHDEDDREGRSSTRHTVRALGRSRVVVSRRLTVTEHAMHTLLSDVSPMDPTIPMAALERLLYQQRDDLRELVLFMAPFVCLNFEAWDEDDADRYVTEYAAPLACVPLLLSVVRKLRRLEKLSVRVGDGRVCRYSGELDPAAAGGLRRLKELRICFVYLNTESKDVPTAVTKDLVACTGGALRLLEVDTYRYSVQLDPDVVVKHLGLVEHVVLLLHACTSDVFIDPHARDEAVGRLSRALRACSSMASLRRLRVSLYFLGNSHQHQCWTPVVAGFRERRPDVAVDFSVQEQ